MGIPKFFRWISERFPLCSQLIAQSHIPEFDNLYLDMNGLIHPCSHGNADDVHARITEQQIFLNIFAYIEHLFGKIRPKKLFYMAVDGVAPRAKINQQRARRFRTAHDAAESVRKALERGEVLPETDAFDSNCITPGTEFMQRLSTALSYFIHKKMNEDANWANVVVILSGPDVPGEGEHKIMDYIRHVRSQPAYDPNTRHVIYGLDADLIMLGLCTHDPHFCLLREEVTFGPTGSKGKVVSNPESVRFYLLHLSLFREYLDLEFLSLKHTLATVGGFVYDLERVIDDFILLALFVGNDFLPHLPTLHIEHGALPVLFDLYKRILPTLGGYLNHSGKIHMHRVERLLKHLAQLDMDKFEQDFATECAYPGTQARSKKSRLGTHASHKPGSVSGYASLTEPQKRILDRLKQYVSSTTNSSEVLHWCHADMAVEDGVFVTKLASELGLYSYHVGEGLSRLVCVSKRMPNKGEEEHDESGSEKASSLSSSSQQEHRTLEPRESDEESEDEESQLARLRVLKKYESLPVVVSTHDSPSASRDTLLTPGRQAYQEFRRSYYSEKLAISTTNQDQMSHIIGSYAQGLQWVMAYYYTGVPSWGWFYPYQYAPMVSDLGSGLHDAIDTLGPWTTGQPFLPFEQLMGVLPSRSIQLLPRAYHDLVVGPDSPIRDFYPDSFETDLNGKKNDWEAVVKIPFVDENRLVSALRTKEAMLTQQERARNGVGKTWMFQLGSKHHHHGNGNGAGGASVTRVVESPAGTHFPALMQTRVTQIEFKLPTVPTCSTTGEKQYLHGLLKGVKLGEDALPGFPTLYTHQFESFMARHGVRVFGPESKNESIVLRVLPGSSGSLSSGGGSSEGTEKVARTYLGRRVYVGWPFLIEACVVGVSDAVFEYTLNNASDHTIARVLEDSKKLEGKDVTRYEHDPVSAQKWEYDARKLEETYSKHFATLIGEVEVVLQVCTLRGMKRLDNGALVKDFGPMSDRKEYPVQIVVERVKVPDPRFIERGPPPLQDEFPVGTKGFYLGDGPLYGSLVEVTGYGTSGRSLDLVAKHPKLESADQATLMVTFTKDVIKKWQDGDVYVPGWKLAKRIGCSSLALSRLTSTAHVIPVDKAGVVQVSEKHNIGLSIKYDARKLKVAGYTRYSSQGGWEYSSLAGDLLREYYQKFPSVFQAFTKDVRSGNGMPTAQELFPGLKEETVYERYMELKEWLKQKAVKSFEQVGLEVEIVPQQYVKELEERANEFVRRMDSCEIQETELTGVAAQLVLLPEQAQYRLASNQKFKIGDRVVFVPNVGSVPMSALGTIIGIEKPEQNSVQREREQTVTQKEHYWLSVLFDCEFLGGNDLGGRCSNQRGSVVSSEAVLNLTYVQPPVFKRFLPNEALQQQQPPPPHQAGGQQRSRQASLGRGSQGKKFVRRDDQASGSSVRQKNVWEEHGNKRQLLHALKKPVPPSQQRPESSSSPKNKQVERTKPAHQPQVSSSTISPDVAAAQLKNMLNISPSKANGNSAIPAPVSAPVLSLSANAPAFKPTQFSALPTSVINAVNRDASKHLMSMLQINPGAPSGPAPVSASSGSVKSGLAPAEDYVLTADLKWVPANSSGGSGAGKRPGGGHRGGRGGKRGGRGGK